jgi:hypothetical protein
LVPLLAVSTVNAARPMTGSGHVVATGSTLISQRTFDHGDLVLFVVNQTLSFTGNLTGSAWAIQINLNHTDTGRITFQGLAHFTGTLNAMSGTLLIGYEGVNNGTFIRGHLEVFGGTGQLAGVKGADRSRVAAPAR